VNHLERVNFHLTNLEVCRRMLMNDKLSSEDVNKLKDPMEMYISALSSDCEDDPTTLEPDCKLKHDLTKLIFRCLRRIGTR
jgi:CCR4-NOT transcriptional regulation complex NOT5 subunit